MNRMILIINFITIVQVGFVIEAMPIIGISEESLTIINGLLADSFPNGVTLQFLLWASSHVEKDLNQWQQARQGRGDIYEILAKRRTDGDDAEQIKMVKGLDEKYYAT